MRNDCMSVSTLILYEKFNVKTINTYEKKIENSIIAAKQDFKHSKFILK